MGTGKSSVGQIVAHELRFTFVDTDQVIERRLGIPISQVFALHGETVFRRFEAELIAEFTAQSGVVISTGGGLVTNPANIASLKTHALVVCLWATPEIIYERVRWQNHRPLLQTPDPVGKIRELLAIREPFYRQADVLIHSGLRSTKEVAQQVIHQFNLVRHDDL